MPKETATDARPGECVYFKGCLLGIGERMTLDPPNELFERELVDLIKKIDKEKSDSQFHCDYHGKCKRRAYVEVFPGGSWSYLCFFHFTLERLRFRKWKYGWCKVND
jgi:hypothetical protein